MTLSTGYGDLFFLKSGQTEREILLAPGKVNIKISDSLLHDLQIDGNPTAMEFNNILKSVRNIPEYAGVYEMQTKWLSSNDIKFKLMLDSMMTVYKSKIDQRKLSYIENNPDSYLNPIFLSEISGIEDQKLIGLYNSLNSRAKKNHIGRHIKYKIDSLMLGSTLPDFILPDTAGNLMTLHNLQKQYVLIDFWASWCIPCRQENPNIKLAYEKYKSKKFTVVGISVDHERARWIKAIHDDGLPWQQLSDLKGLNNTAFRKYALNKVPSNFLVGPDGKILAIDLRGDKLLSELNRLLR
jgi:peroxiredoxin